MAVRPAYTYEFSSYPKSLTPVRTFKDVDDSIATLVNSIKDFQEKGKYEEANNLIKANYSLLKDYVLDTSYLNLIDETTRNLELFCNDVAESFNTSAQCIFYQQAEPSAKQNDVWVSDSSASPTTSTPIYGNVNPEDVLRNKKYFRDFNGVQLNGSMEDLRGRIVNPSSIVEVGNDAVFYLNDRGLYDDTSQVRVPINTLKTVLPSINVGGNGKCAYFYSSSTDSVVGNLPTQSLAFDDTTNSIYGTTYAIDSSGNIEIKENGKYKVFAFLDRFGDYTSLGLLKNGTLIAGQDYVDATLFNVGTINQDIFLSAGDLLTLSAGGMTLTNDTLGYNPGSYMWIAKIS